jgi:hypothetical protein
MLWAMMRSSGGVEASPAAVAGVSWKSRIGVGVLSEAERPRGVFLVIVGVQESEAELPSGGWRSQRSGLSRGGWRSKRSGAVS